MAIQRVKTECTCNVCKEMCRRSPCFPDPLGAVLLIAAGYKDRLRASVWKGTLHGREFNWPLIAPRFIEGHGCTFFTKGGLCQLHELALKPIEGQLAIHSLQDDGLRKAICFTWVSPLGIETMKQFEDTENEVILLSELLKLRK